MVPKSKVSKATRERMRLAHLGKKHSAATIAKITASKRAYDDLVRQGIIPRWHHTAATKKRLSRLARQRKKRGKYSGWNNAARAEALATRKLNQAENKRNKEMIKQLKRDWPSKPSRQHKVV